MSLTSSSSTARRCGAIVSDTGTRFRVWAPNARRVTLRLHDGDAARSLDLKPEPDGYFSLDVDGVGPGQRYAFRLDDGPERADPYSLSQPDGPAAASEVFDPSDFAPAATDWRGVARRDLVIYEMHVGTFTDAGTFDGAIDRLDDLAELGITAVEVMPIAQWSGDRNWGYDGVLPFAAQNSYGGPAAFQRFIDACHARGLGVILDVVYNHFGPEHNYFREFGPYFTHKYNTPWGDAINYDDRGSDAVRAMVLDNARMWLEEFGCDGLRLDAVHAIYDLGANPLLAEIGKIADEVAESTGIPRTIIAESDLADPRLLEPRTHNGMQLGAQWADDLHHAIHVALTGETKGYFAGFVGNASIATALNTPFVHAGKFNPVHGRVHGRQPVGLGGDRFVVCIQNHDQVGNRAIGDRLTTVVNDFRKLRLAASIYLLSPYLPMLWMGEEYGEDRPFPFFCGFEGAELAEAVRQGRAREFADFVDAAHKVPDPMARETFESAKLGWSWPDGSPNAGLRQLYKDLLAARRQWPELRTDIRHAKLCDDNLLVMRRDATLRIFFNLSTEPQARTIGGRAIFSSELAQYGGARKAIDRIDVILPFEAIAVRDR